MATTVAKIRSNGIDLYNKEGRKVRTTDFGAATTLQQLYSKDNDTPKLLDSMDSDLEVENVDLSKSLTAGRVLEVNGVKYLIELEAEQRQIPSGVEQDYRTRFIQLLQQTHITTPDDRVIDLIVRCFATRLIVASTPEDALDLYNIAEIQPGSSTRAEVIGQLGITINGPLSEHLPPIILTATNNNAAPIIIKLISPNNLQEIETVETIHQNEPPTSIVEMEILQVSILPQDAHITKHFGVFRALKMPWFPAVLATLPQLPLTPILQQAQRIEQAIIFLHSHNLIHMDIKGANIFVDLSGQWFLGDFGCTVQTGTNIRGYSELYYPEKLQLKADLFAGLPITTAKASYDWYMFLVMILIELHKENYKTVLFDPVTRRVSRAKVDYCIASIKQWDLQKFCLTIALRSFL